MHGAVGGHGNLLAHVHLCVRSQWLSMLYCGRVGGIQLGHWGMISATSFQEG
jgi:hypothetical protein